MSGKFTLQQRTAVHVACGCAFSENEWTADPENAHRDRLETRNRDSSDGTDILGRDVGSSANEG